MATGEAAVLRAGRQTSRTYWRMPPPALPVALGFLLPALGLALLFDYWPALQSLRLMFYNWNLVATDAQFVGWQNFQTILADPRFATALRNTAVYAAALIPLQIVLPLGIALVLRPLATSRLSTLYRSLLFLPMVISLPVASVV
ncbi:MAG: sugar ABC transporter permease, partial [Chloroflexia bacterium]|nr:sugar ABC transporter permease [Chloroflexia bacterium]